MQGVLPNLRSIREPLINIGARQQNNYFSFRRLLFEIKNRVGTFNGMECDQNIGGLTIITMRTSCLDTSFI